MKTIARFSLRLLMLVFVISTAACSDNNSNNIDEKDAVSTQGKSSFSVSRANSSDPAALHSADDRSFRIIDIDESILQGKPVISLNFSTALDAFRSYRKWVKVYTEDGQLADASWVLSDDGKSLYLPGIEARKTYTIVVQPGIIALDGQSLAEEERFVITTKHLQAFAGFSGKGKIIPAGTQAGLPVRSVNVASIDVDYFKVPVDKLQFLLTQFSTASSRSSYSIDRITSSSSRVYSAEYAISSEKDHTVDTLLPLDKKITDVPGVYFAIIRRSGVYEYSYPMTYFTVSDIGLHLRQYKNNWSVFTSLLSSGRANAGVSIRVLDKQGSILVEGKSDETGRLNLPVSATVLNDGHILLALKDRQLAVMNLKGPALDVSEFDLPARPFKEREYFIYGPRDAYRPGELLQFSALLRDFDGQLIPATPIVAKLVRPDGSVANRQTLAAESNGYYRFQYQLAATVPTGRWQLQLSLKNGADTGAAKYFLIEDFMPERIRMNFSQKPDAMLSLGQLQEITVQADYLYGAPAAGNTLRSQLTLSRARTPFPQLPGFEFGADDKSVQAQVYFLDAKSLDNNGQGILTLPGPVLAAISRYQGPVAVEYQSSVEESGGRPVKRRLKVYSWKNGIWPGIRAEFNKDENALVNQNVRFSLVAAAGDGKAIAGRELSVELISLNRRSYWEYSNNDGWGHQHVDDPRRIWQQQFVTEASPAVIQVPVNKGVYRLRVIDADGNVSATEFRIGQDWWGYENVATAARPDKITVTLDRPGYKAGDTVKVRLQAPRPGSGFLLAENSDGILFFQRIQLSEKARVFELVIPADDENWQRHDIRLVSLIVQPEKQTKHGVAMRSLGMQSIPLDRTDKHIRLTIDAPVKVEPQTMIKLRLSSDRADQNLRVTVSAVDQGVLSITGFETPDPFKYFYQPRLAEVDARDNYTDVLNVKDMAFARQRSGGDTEEMVQAGELAKSNVLIVSLFKGPVRFDAQGKAELELEMPDFNGALRLMVAAYTDDEFGAAETELQVKAPVVTQLSLPRFAAFGDETQLTLDIQNTLQQTQTLTLKWQLQGAGLKDTGQASTTIVLAKDQKQSIRLPVVITQSTGAADIQLQVSSEDTDFSRHWRLSLRPAFAAETFQKKVFLGEHESIYVDSTWLQHKLPESLQLRYSVSTYPSLNTAEQWQNLLQYPYGCLEQTASRARPLAAADDELRQQLQMALPEGVDRLKAVQDAINRLQTMQRLQGGFGLWDAKSAEEYWLTAYVTDFLLTARDKGFQVPQAMLDKAIKRLQYYVNDNRLRTAGKRYGDSQHYRFAYRSYAAYVLAKQAKAPLGTLRQWLDGYSNESKSPLPLVHLAIALKLQGDSDRAAKAIAIASRTMRKENVYLGDYGSRIRDDALVLALNLKYGLQLPGVEDRLQQLSEEIYRRSYLSTQEQDAVLQLALLLESRAADKPWSASLHIGTVSIDLQSSASWSKVLKGARAATASIELTGRQKLFVSQTLIAHSSRPPAKQFNGFSIKREWFDSNGNAIADKKFQSGDFVIVRLQVTADQRSPDAMIVDMLPAGFELENPGLQHATPLSRFLIEGKKIAEMSNQYPSTLKHKEYRDDRFVAAVDLYANSTMELTYLMRAVTPGHYQVPSAFVEDMYRPELRAVGAPFSPVTISSGIAKP